jgi:hypothetical protein
MRTVEPASKAVTVWHHPVVCIASAVPVVAVVAWILHRICDALFIPWWFNTDEVVFFYEVIRQLRLEPTQTFFDIPGTPYMTLASFLTAGWWGIMRIAGSTDAATPSDFAFENIQAVYTLMRAITVCGYALAVGLCFDLFRRAAGGLVGAFAAILLATLPVHVHYSHFVRTESFGLVLCLGAIWLVLHSRSAGSNRIYLIAGALAGVAMAARYHFALVGLPVLLTLYWCKDRPARPSSNTNVPFSWHYWTGLGLAAFFAAGAAVAGLYKAGLMESGTLTETMLLSTAAGPDQYADAKRTISRLWFLLGGISLGMVTLFSFARLRPFLRPFVNTLTLSLLIGFAGGFLAAHPTFLWRGEQQLRSIQFYSDWIDPELASRGPLSSWWNVTEYYFTAALPETWLQLCFAAGAILIAFIWRRQAAHLAFLVGAVTCFVAHPVTMKLWSHHIIPWLPFLCFVAALPAGWIASLLTRLRPTPAFGTAVTLVACALLTWSLHPRLLRAGEYLQTSRARTEQIAEMNQWLEVNVPADSFLAVSYFSLADSGFMKWMELSGVRVPDHVRKHKDVHIWWLERHSLEGRTGYICVARADILFFRGDFERRNPGSTVDPFEDTRFVSIATFGGGIYELQVFKFDFRPIAGH